MALEKITYVNKTNPKPIVDRSKQATADDFNEIKAKFNNAVDVVENFEPDNLRPVIKGSFKVGGTSSNYYPVVFSNVKERRGSIRIYRDNLHLDAIGRGSLNLLITNISPSKYGNIDSYFEVSYAKHGSGNLAKWTCQNNRGIETIIYLLGDTTYHYELEDVTILNFNNTGSVVNMGNSQTASPTPKTNTSPITSPYIFIVENPVNSGRYTVNYYSDNAYVKNTVTCATLVQTSDKNFKTNIEPIDGSWALVVFKKLNFSFYDFSLTNSKQAGLIAQEVEKVLPQAVHTSDNGEKGLNHTYIDMVCKAAIQHFIKIQIQ